MEERRLSCVDCGTESCAMRDGKNPPFCLTTALTEEELQEVMDLYQEDQNHDMSLVAAELESTHYCTFTRVEETIVFAKKMGMKKLGIATCGGLLEESRVLAKILRFNGFEVVTAICKMGSMDKTETFGLDPVHTCRTGKIMCNPILQAKTMNKEQVDMALVVGLCVGHDTLFYKYVEVPVTTIVVKERVTGHNPVQPLHMTKGRQYYSRLLREQVEF